MIHSDASITTIFGMRGCGKSTLTRMLAEKHPRKIIFDFVEEWEGTHVATDFNTFANIWREIFNRDEYTILVRFKFGTDAGIIQETASQIAALAYHTGKDGGLRSCLIFEEAQFYFPNAGLHPVFLGLITTGRHAHLDIIANTQRPASVSKLLISQSAEMYIGSLYESNDIKYLSDTVGSLAEEARTLQKLSFIYYPVGNPESICVVEI